MRNDYTQGYTVGRYLSSRSDAMRYITDSADYRGKGFYYFFADRPPILSVTSHPQWVEYRDGSWHVCNDYYDRDGCTGTSYTLIEDEQVQDELSAWLTMTSEYWDNIHRNERITKIKSNISNWEYKMNAAEKAIPAAHDIIRSSAETIREAKIAIEIAKRELSELV